MTQTRPNILFIMSDDHACRAIGAYGSVINRTPNLDRIAGEGALFRESFCGNSLCAPSRASILTGKHSHTNGQLLLGQRFDGSQTTYPKLLRAAGYTTALIGKWHLNSDPTGFDFWKIIPGQGSYYNPDFILPDGPLRESGYSTDLITDNLLAWLTEQRDREKPFAAMCHFKAPHRPWNPAPRYLHLYEDTVFPEPPSLFDDYAGRSGLLKTNKMQISPHMTWNYDLKVNDPGPNRERLSWMREDFADGFETQRMMPEELAAWGQAYARRRHEAGNIEMDDEGVLRWAYQEYLKDYLRCIAAIDENVGRILDYLDANGLTESTLVIYCSDQGFYLGEHGWYDKRWMFEESMRMPLLMRWPGRIEPGTVYTQLVQNIDYAPTFLEIAGVKPPADMHGKSLLSVIDRGESLHEHLYYHYYEHGGHGVPKHDGIRNERYKLVHFYTVPEFNLFDLRSDPCEMRSVHDDPTYADVLRDMQATYWGTRRSLGVPEEYGPEADRADQ